MGTTALVRAEILASMLWAVTHQVDGSTSAKTGLAPTCKATLAAAKNPKPGTIISSPGFTPSPRNAICNAVVPFEAEIAHRLPIHLAKSDSKRSTNGPPEIHVEAKASTTYCCSFPQKFGFAQGITCNLVIPILSLLSEPRGTQYFSSPGEAFHQQYDPYGIFFS